MARHQPCPERARPHPGGQRCGEGGEGGLAEAERSLRLALSHYLSCECPFIDDLYWEAAGLMSEICCQTGRSRVGELWAQVAASGASPEWEWDAGEGEVERYASLSRIEED